MKVVEDFEQMKKEKHYYYFLSFYFSKQHLDLQIFLRQTSEREEILPFLLIVYRVTL